MCHRQPQGLRQAVRQQMTAAGAPVGPQGFCLSLLVISLWHPTEITMLTSLYYIRSLRLSQSHTEVSSVSLPKGHPRASLVEWTLKLAVVVTSGPNRQIQNSLLWLKVGGEGGIVCVGVVSLSCLTLPGAAISLVTLNSAHSPSEISSLAQVLTVVQLLDVL